MRNKTCGPDRRQSIRVKRKNHFVDQQIHVTNNNREIKLIRSGRSKDSSAIVSMNNHFTDLNNFVANAF